MKFIRTLMKLIILVALGIGAYYLSYYLSQKYVDNVSLSVTFDDHDTFSLENVNPLSKEEALKEWPYIFNIENNSKRDTHYQLKIEKVKGNIKEDDLAYIIVVDDLEVASGSMKDLEDNLLFQNQINGYSKQKYQLYVYVTNQLNDNLEEINYEYKVTLLFK